MDIFNEDYLDVMKLAAFTSLPEVLNILLENDEGIDLLTLLGAIMLGAEVDSGGDGITVKIKSSSKNFEITYPVENITDALWVNIQGNAGRLKDKILANPTKSG